MTSPWATASVIGREHVRVARNNQDAVAAMAGEGLSVAVVCDGCGSEARSEVGAQLGARFLAGWLRVHAGDHPEGHALAEAVSGALASYLRGAAQSLDPEPSLLTHTLSRYFLFTWLAAVRTPGRVVVLGQGDGAVVVDDAVLTLESGILNAPEYAAYDLFDGKRRHPTVHHDGPAARVALCTDGLKDLLTSQPTALAPLFEDDVVFRNPVHLQRRLTVLADEQKLHDDATLAISRSEG